MSRATGLDHAAFVVADLDRAATQWAALGFDLTPVATHTDGAGEPTGTGNRCAMLAGGYLELLAVINPARPSRTIAGMLARYEGGHILSLATDDAEAALARLIRARLIYPGLATALAATSRETQWGTARFERLPFADLAPRLQLIRHLTPELVWRPEQLRHPNQAASLEEVVIASDTPAVFSAMLSRVAGRPIQPDRLDGYTLNLPAGRVRVLTPGATATLFPGHSVPTLPCAGLLACPGLPCPGLLPYIAGVVLRTADANAAVTARAIGRPIPGGRIASATGAAILFIP